VPVEPVHFLYEPKRLHPPLHVVPERRADACPALPPEAAILTHDGHKVCLALRLPLDHAKHTRRIRVVLIQLRDGEEFGSPRLDNHFRGDQKVSHCRMSWIVDDVEIFVVLIPGLSEHGRDARG